MKQHSDTFFIVRYVAVRFNRNTLFLVWFTLRFSKRTCEQCRFFVWSTKKEQKIIRTFNSLTLMVCWVDTFACAYGLPNLHHARFTYAIPSIFVVVSCNFYCLILLLLCSLSQLFFSLSIIFFFVIELTPNRFPILFTPNTFDIERQTQSR